MGAIEPVIQQIPRRLARAEIKVVSPLLHRRPQVLGDGDAGRSAAFPHFRALAVGAFDAMFFRFFPSGEQRFERFRFDRHFFWHG